MRYKGYFYDCEANLYYLQSRFYDPSIYRFISADDINFIDPSRISGLNLFCYCNNNAVMGYDPSGNFNITSTTDRLNLISSTVFIGLGAAFGGEYYFIKNLAVRPSYMQKSIWARKQSQALKSLTTKATKLNKVASGVGVALLALNVLEMGLQDFNNGLSAGRIASNAYTNTLVYGGIAFGAAKIGAKIGTFLLPVPILGTALGFAIGLGIGILATRLLEWQINDIRVIDHIRDWFYNQFNSLGDIFSNVRNRLFG